MQFIECATKETPLLKKVERAIYESLSPELMARNISAELHKTIKDDWLNKNGSVAA